MPINNAILDRCRKLVSDPEHRNAYLSDLNRHTRGLVGIFSNYIPPEIIAAAGFHPLRIIGSFKTSGTHPQALYNPACSFVQDVYAAAGNDAFSMLTQIVFPNSCDSLKLLYQQWNQHVGQPQALRFLHPIRDDEVSVSYCAQQLKHLGEDLKNAGGFAFNEDHIRTEINLYNTVRQLQRRLFAIQKNNPASLAGSDLIAVITAGLIMDHHEYLQLLQQVITEAQSPSPEPPETSYKKIMIIGPLVDNLLLLKQIEQQGVYVVDNDITNGTRCIGRDISTQGNPYINLAEYCLRAAPSPTLYTDPVSELTVFRKRIADLNPNGVFFIIQKYCEPHVHNYLFKIEMLRQMGIPTLMLEIEHAQDNLAPADLLRIESFLEMSSTG